MAQWNKILVSGSNIEVNDIIASGNVTFTNPIVNNTNGNILILSGSQNIISSVTPENFANNLVSNVSSFTQGSIIFADSDGSLTENNNQLYWDNVNNRLGIGTKNPTEKLDVAKKTNLTATTSTISAFTHTSTETTTAGFGINVDFKLQQPNSGNLVTANRVTSKWNNQSVSGEYTISSMYSATVGSQGSLHNVATFGVSPVTGLPGIITLHDTPSQSSRIKSENGRLIVDVGSQGSLYLGNFNAVKRVSNSTLITGFSGVVFSGNNSISTHMLINSTGNVGIGTTSPDAKLTIEGSLSAASQGMENLLTLRRGFNSGVAFESSAALSLGRSLSDLHSRLDFILDDNNSAGHEYDSTVLTMLSNGNVGIGTTAPSEKLDVNGNIKTNGILKLYDVTDTQQIELNPNGDSYILNGNIGIGTSNPERNLHVADDVRIDSELYVRTISTQYFSNTSNLNLIYGNAANFTIYSNTTERFRITSDGNVGIGTDTPNDKLDIDGDIRVKRTNRKPTHEDVLTSDFVSVGSVSFYTDDWVKVKVIGRGDTGLNKSFAEYLIYYDGTAYNIELLNNIIVGDNSGFPLLRMNGSNLEIKNRDSVNVGNYLIYFDDFISQTLFSGKTYRVEDFPLIWINDLYYNTYKDNTFVPNQNISIPNQSDYDTVTSILVNIKSLTTDFTGTLLGKFNNLSNLQCFSNQISVLDVSQNTNLTQLMCYDNQLTALDVSQLVNLNILYCFSNQISTLDVSQLTSLTVLYCFNNQISVLDVSQLVNLTSLLCDNNQISTLDVSQLVNLTRLHCFTNQITTLDLSQLTSLTVLQCYNNQIATLDVSQLTSLTTFFCFNNLISVLDVSNLVNLTDLRCQNNELDTATNSQILADLDGNGLSNGYFQSTIFGGGYLTPLGVESAISLNSKNWNIVGLTYVLQTGTSYDIEDFPLAWIEENNFATYSGNTFQVVSDRNMPTQTEYDAVTDINLSNQSLTTDFTFLDRYSNLVILYLQDNSISNLDLSGFNTLNYVNCTNNNVSILDVTSHIGISSILCAGNNISILDVENLTELRDLRCYFNNISVLNITNLNKLVRVNCAGNNISILDVSNCILVEYLDCASNNISILDVTNLVSLTFLFCQYNNISVLNTANLVNVTAVYCFNNNITTLDATGLISCTNLRCYNNQLDAATNSQILIDLDTNGLSNGYLHSSIFGGGFITPTGIDSFNSLLSKSWSVVGLTNQISAGSTYNVEDFPKIWIDDLYYNTYKGDTFVPSINTLMTGQTEYDTVTSIDLNSQSLTTDFTNELLSKFSNLSNLRCYNNQISVLDVSQLVSLNNELHCANNQISVLDVSQLVNLRYLYCDTNQISVLDVSQLVDLLLLRCYDNQISTLDVSQLVNLTYLNCHTNQISVLDVSNLTSLTFLDCASNSISVLDLNNLTSLTYLHCAFNQLSILDVTNLVNLTYLQCGFNQLSILDVTNLVNLTYLSCQVTQLTVLDVTNLVNLTYLQCGFNQLSILDVTNLVNLTYLSCFNNQLTVLDVTNLVNLTTLQCAFNQLSILDVTNLVNLTFLSCFNNQLDNIVNSQILIDLDSHGLSNGYFSSSIFGGGSLTTAGQTAKTNLLSKGWTIVGI